MSGILETGVAAGPGVSAIAVGMVAGGYALKRTITWIRNIVHMTYRVDYVVSKMFEEFSPNGGNSLRDRMDNVESDVAHIKKIVIKRYEQGDIND